MSFDPHLQNVTFLGSDGVTPVQIPLPVIDALNHESFSICINYGAQLGACFVMLLIVLAMTPSSKLRRPSSLLHIAGLVICTIRMALLAAFFPSPFNNFYVYWAMDYSQVPAREYNTSIAANVFSLLLVVAVEVALMHQAWTMVTLWPGLAKLILGFLSASITMLTIGFRVAFTIIQSQAVLSLEPPRDFFWLIHWMIITNTLSICWFCALFNVKLVHHLVVNRRILPSYKTLTPMEILVMTNGVLMVVPVIFTGLEWGHFTNFEAGSLTMTSVIVILPLGTLVAQRMAQTPTPSYASNPSSGFRGGLPGSSTNSGMPFKAGSSFSASSRGTPTAAILSRCEASGTSHYVDLELAYVESHRDLIDGRVRVDHDLEQRVSRV